MSFSSFPYSKLTLSRYLKYLTVWYHIVNNIVDYLGKAVDCYNDTLVNPDNYNIIQQTPRPGYEAAHKYTHKTTGLFIVVADSSQDILSFGGRTP